MCFLSTKLKPPNGKSKDATIIPFSLVSACAVVLTNSVPMNFLWGRLKHAILSETTTKIVVSAEHSFCVSHTVKPISKPIEKPIWKQVVVLTFHFLKKDSYSSGSLSWSELPNFTCEYWVHVCPPKRGPTISLWVLPIEILLHFFALSGLEGLETPVNRNP